MLLTLTSAAIYAAISPKSTWVRVSGLKLDMEEEQDSVEEWSTNVVVEVG
jgi:hypothetical protein